VAKILSRQNFADFTVFLYHDRNPRKKYKNWINREIKSMRNWISKPIFL